MKKILCCVLCLLILFSNTIHAEDTTITIDVIYPNESSIRCNEDVSFEVIGGGSYDSSYKYMLNAVDQKIDGQYQMVVDPSKFGNYQDSNIITFNFSCSGEYRLAFYVLGKVNETQFSYVRKYVYLNIVDDNYPSLDVIANNLVNEAIKSGCNDDYSKALWFHDYLTSTVDYDYSYKYCGIEGALARKKGTCESFYGAYHLLLSEANISDARIIGNGHVWNAVKIGDEWMQVDCTWDIDKTNSFIQHLYFGLNDELMALAHSDHSPNQGAESNTLELNYFIKTDEIKTYSDPFVYDITNHLNNNEKSFEVEIKNSPISSAYYKIMYRLVAYDLSKGKWLRNNEMVEIEVTYEDGNCLKVRTVEDDFTITLDIPDKYKKDEVWIDGIKYIPNIENDLSIIEYQDDSAKIATVYQYNANNIPVGMKTYKLDYQDRQYDVTDWDKLDNLLTYNGFSVRVISPAGIRFKTGINIDLKKELINTGSLNYKLIELGTLSISKSKLDIGSPLILNATGVKGGRAYWLENNVVNDKVFETVNNQARFTSVLVGIPKDNYDTYISFRGYAKLSNGNDEIIVYGPIVSRSIYYVSKQVMASNEFKEGSAGYNFIKDIIDTVEGQ